MVTSSKNDYLDLVFELTNIRDYFDLVITGDQITKGKPDPESYLLASRKLEVNPSECVVFEDAPNGILAGKNAAMKVIAIPSQFVKGDETFSKADLVLDSLEELTLEKIKAV